MMVKMEGSNKPRIVYISGGTGKFGMLKGLKNLAHNIIITDVTDEGGSSGKLRVEHGALPPGAGSQALAATARTEEDEIFLLDRYDCGSVNGHKIANLMYEVAARHFGPIRAWEYLVEKYCVTGTRILPVSLESNVRLIVTLEDGTEIIGESKIDKRGKGSPIVKARLSREDIKATPEVLKEIEKSDIVLFGPSDIWTSMVPLLIPEVAEAIRNTMARKIMMCNLFTDPKESEGYKASDFAEVITRYVGQGETFKLDDFIVNTTPIDEPLVDKAYQKENKVPVLGDLIDEDRLSKYTHRIHRLPLAGLVRSNGSNFFRHNGKLSAEAIIKVWRGSF